MRTKSQGGVVVGFDGQSHVLIRDDVVIWEDDHITFIVDGNVIMENRHMPAAPPVDELLACGQQYAEAYWAYYPQLDWNGRSIDEAFPNAFPWVDDPST
jgi:hypothetical protein